MNKAIINYLFALLLVICASILAYLTLAFLFWDINFLTPMIDYTMMRMGIVLLVVLTTLIGITFDKVDLVGEIRGK